jgi:hypothetical protein
MCAPAAAALAELPERRAEEGVTADVVGDNAARLLPVEIENP